MNAPLAQFLVQFSDYKIEEPVEEALLEPIEEVVEELEEPEPTVTMTTEAFESALREARELAASDERIRMEALADLRLEEQRIELKREFDAARESWANEEGRGMAASLTTAIEKIEQELAGGVANALRPLLSDACRKRVLAEMHVALATILSDPGNPAVRIEGPADLLTAFGSAQPENVSIDYIVSEQTELTIITDSTRIESRLSACLASLNISEGA